jgi:hypothetical protein
MLNFSLPNSRRKLSEVCEYAALIWTENTLKGKYNGGPLPLGYVVNADGYFKIDAMTASIVLDIFKLYQSGMTLKEVAVEIERRGIRSRHNKVIPPSSITKILRNRKYIGEYVFKDIVQPNVVPEIVPRELFDAVQERLNKNLHAPARFKAKEERYLLSTKLFCGSCGVFMTGESGTGKSGATFRYYKCAVAKQRKGCKRKAIRKAVIEDFVIEYIRRILLDDVLLKEIAEKLYSIQKQDNSELPI